MPLQRKYSGKRFLEDVIEYQRDNPDANQNSPNAGPEEKQRQKHAQENENLL